MSERRAVSRWPRLLALGLAAFLLAAPSFGTAAAPPSPQPRATSGEQAFAAQPAPAGQTTTAPASSAAPAERQLMRHGTLEAFVAGEDWCAPDVAIRVRTADVFQFGGDRLELQRLVGQLRALVPFECPSMQRLLITGEVGGRIAFSGIADEARGGVLEAQPLPDPTAAAASAPPAPTPAASEFLAPDPAAPAQNRNRGMVRETQRLLNSLGFDAGPVDGAFGRRTRGAIEAFEQSRGLAQRGDVTAPLLDALGRDLVGTVAAPSQSATGAPTAHIAASDPADPGAAPAASVSDPEPDAAGSYAVAADEDAGLVPPAPSGSARHMPQNDAELIAMCEADLYDAFVVPVEYRTPSAPLGSFIRMALPDCAGGNSILFSAGSFSGPYANGFGSVQMLRSEPACPGCDARVLFYCVGDQVGPRIAYREGRATLSHGWDWPDAEARRAGEEAPVHRVRYAPYGWLLRSVIEDMGGEAVPLTLHDFTRAFRQGQIDCVAGVSTTTATTTSNSSAMMSPDVSAPEAAVDSSLDERPGDDPARERDGSPSLAATPSAHASEQPASALTPQPQPALPDVAAAEGQTRYVPEPSGKFPFSPQDMELIARCKEQILDTADLPPEWRNDDRQWGGLSGAMRWCDERLANTMEGVLGPDAQNMQLLLVQPVCETCLLNVELYCDSTIAGPAELKDSNIIYAEPGRSFASYAWIVRPIIEALAAEPVAVNAAEWSTTLRRSASCVMHLNVGEASQAAPGEPGAAAGSGEPMFFGIHAGLTPSEAYAILEPINDSISWRSFCLDDTCTQKYVTVASKGHFGRQNHPPKEPHPFLGGVNHDIIQTSQAIGAFRCDSFEFLGERLFKAQCWAAESSRSQFTEMVDAARAPDLHELDNDGARASWGCGHGSGDCTVTLTFTHVNRQLAFDVSWDYREARKNANLDSVEIQAADGSVLADLTPSEFSTDEAAASAETELRALRMPENVGTPALLLPDAETLDLLVARFLPEEVDADMIERMIGARWAYENTVGPTDTPSWGAFFLREREGERFILDRATADAELVPLFLQWTLDRAASLPPELTFRFPLAEAQPGIVSFPGARSIDHDWIRSEVSSCKRQLKASRSSGDVARARALEPTCEFLETAMDLPSGVIEYHDGFDRNTIGPRGACGSAVGRADAYCNASAASLRERNAPRLIDVFATDKLVNIGPELARLAGSDAVVELVARIEGIEVADTLLPRPWHIAAERTPRLPQGAQQAYLWRLSAVVARLVDVEAEEPIGELELLPPPVLPVVQTGVAPTGMSRGGPDVMGIQLGMTFDEAERLVREQMAVGLELVADRGFQAGAAVGNLTPFTSGRVFFSEDASEVLVLYDDPPAAEGLVVGIARQILLPKGQATPAAVTNSLRQKYGSEDLLDTVMKAAPLLVWGDAQVFSQGARASYQNCLPIDTQQRRTREIWRLADGQPPEWGEGEGRARGVFPALRPLNFTGGDRAGENVIGCPRGVAAMFEPGSQRNEWDSLYVWLFDLGGYVPLIRESSRLLKAGEPVGEHDQPPVDIKL